MHADQEAARPGSVEPGFAEFGRRIGWPPGSFHGAGIRKGDWNLRRLLYGFVERCLLGTRFLILGHGMSLHPRQSARARGWDLLPWKTNAYY